MIEIESFGWVQSKIRGLTEPWPLASLSGPCGLMIKIKSFGWVQSKIKGLTEPGPQLIYSTGYMYCTACRSS